MKQQKNEQPKEKKVSMAKKDELEKLRNQADSLQKEKDEIFSQMQRISADYANYQKRTPKQISDTIAYEKEKIIKTLLPILDNFEHTLTNVKSAEDAESIIKGVRIIYDQMLDILKSNGVEQIKALGEKFEPALHEAMMQKSEVDKKENIVLEEFQKGYKLNGRVIRPSKVVVNKLPTAQEAKQQEQETNSQPQNADENQEKDA